MATLKSRYAARAALLMLAPLIMFWAGCATLPPTTPTGEYVLRIAHVNDVHAHLDPVNTTVYFDKTKTYLDLGGMPRLAQKVETLRGDGGPDLLLLHAGDAFQGTLYFTKFKGQADLEFMNLLAFDAMTTGNHEFDKGPAVLADFIRRADFPVVSANVDASADPNLSGLIEPYVIKTLGREKVGILGLTTAQTAVASQPGDLVAFQDPAASAAKTVAALEAQGVDKIIALTHLGYPEDLKLAAAVPGIDVIIGGHSHTLLGDFTALGLNPAGPYPTEVTGPQGQKVCVGQAWEWAKALGLMTVSFDGQGRVVSCSGQATLLAADNFKQKDADGKKQEVGPETRDRILELMAGNPEIEYVTENHDFASRLAVYQAQLDSLTHQVVAKVGQDLLHIRRPGRHSSGQDLPHGSQIAPHVSQSMYYKANLVGLDVDLALVNGGGVRQDLLAGDLTVGDIYTLLPFENTVIVLTMTGDQIKRGLEYGVGPEEGAFPYPAGLRYTCDQTRASGDRITRMEVQGPDGAWTPVDPRASYRVAVSSFVAGGGDGNAVFMEPTERYDTGFVDAEVFSDYAAAQGILSRPTVYLIDYRPAP
jgi:5'-nucleotidase